MAEIYCTGDLLGYGANPNEVIELLWQNNVKSLMGNHDYACLDQRSRDEMIRSGRESIDYSKQVLTPERLIY